MENRNSNNGMPAVSERSCKPQSRPCCCDESSLYPAVHGAYIWLASPRSPGRHKCKYCNKTLSNNLAPVSWRGFTLFIFPHISAILFDGDCILKYQLLKQGFRCGFPASILQLRLFFYLPREATCIISVIILHIIVGVIYHQRSGCFASPSERHAALWLIQNDIYTFFPEPRMETKESMREWLC